MYCKKSRINQGQIEIYMEDMTDKEVAIWTNKEWNVMSQEDAMIISLMSVIDESQKKSKFTKKD
jgi:hypothetical protein